ncbi:unannotated protein [freshwater metagenome]|uniref:Unannotated protein n=1 Tax=freshwater metagenome TaxID=449393 RepID=A0A6J6X3F8_9ZZZZ
MALVEWHAGAVVLHGDPDMADWLAFVFGLRHDDLGLAAAVEPGVIDEVGNHASESASIDVHHKVLGALRDRDFGLGHAADADGLTHELGHDEVFEMKANRARIESGDFEQVFDEALKP